MSVLSKLSSTSGVLIITAGVCTLAFVYFLKKNLDPSSEYENLVSARGRQTVLELPVPKSLVGGIIGRQGSNIKAIEKQTKTRINCRDKDEQHNIIVIRGQADCVKEAETAIKLTIQEQEDQVTLTMVIPSSCCGRVIGKGGSTIRELATHANVKINVERDSGNFSRNPDSMREVTIVGTRDSTELAKKRIENIVSEEREFQLRKSTRCNEDSHQGLHRLKAAEEEVEFDEYGGKIERLISSASDGFLEGFMSAVDTPNRFWVQPVGTNSTELDKLNDEMTSYYKTKEKQELHTIQELKVGDLVAAQFPYDDMWYRARVIQIHPNDYDETESTVSIYFGDFGETVTTKQSELLTLREDYHRLPFQSVECTLSSVKPDGEDWTEDAIETFKVMTYATQWKKIMVRPLGTFIRDTIRVYILDIVDTTGKYDVNVAEELIRRSLAISDMGDWTNDDEGAAEK